jgi:hypothetical protein
VLQKEIRSSYDTFIKTLNTEYVDFFKSRKNIKVEFEMLAQKNRGEQESIAAGQSQLKRKQEVTERILETISEKLKLMGIIQLSDMALRQQLQEDLHLSSVTNNGYLLLEKYHGNRAGAQPTKATSESVLQSLMAANRTPERKTRTSHDQLILEGTDTAMSSVLGPATGKQSYSSLS